MIGPQAALAGILVRTAFSHEPAMIVTYEEEAFASHHWQFLTVKLPSNLC